MNKFLRSNGQKLLSAFIFVIFAFAVQTQAQVVNEILNKVEAHRKALSTLRADITMGKYNPDLNEWTYSKGKVMLVAKTNTIKDALLKIDWKEPREEILSIVKGKYVAYTPGLKQAYTGEATANEAQKKGGNALSFLTMSKAELTANYTGKYLGEEKLDGGVPTWHLTFVPKAASKYKSADIWVDGNGMILQVKIVPASGDETNVRLANLEKNISLNTSQFVVNLPKDTKIIKG
jgi:outer membrane lipoprotein-sorting protein